MLPDDPKKWPNDPFELLGVEQDASEKEVKRAFFRLAKQFKPDQHPVEFQKIHDAYDLAKRMQSFPGQLAPRADDIGNDSLISSGRILEEIDQFKIPPARKRASETQDDWSTVSQPKGSASHGLDPAKLFWRYLSDGKFDEASLVTQNIENKLDQDAAEFSQYYIDRISDRRFGPAEAAKRLEHLLKYSVHPNYGYAALHFLTNELQCNPQLGEHAVITEYIENTTAFDRAAAVAKIRWQAIGAENPIRVVDDMRLLARNSKDHPAHWDQLLADAMEYTVWSWTPNCQNFNDEAWQMLSENQDGLADTVELLKLAAEQCHTPFPAWGKNEIGRLIPLARIGFPRWMAKDWQGICLLYTSPSPRDRG